jgi:acyl-CoA dehydrogenase
MDFEIPQDISMMVETVRNFVKKALEPISQKVEEEDHIPEEIVEQMRGLGLFGLSIPEEYGGLGLSMLGEVMVQEELAKTNGCFRSRISTNNGLGSQGLIISGTEEQKKRYLPKIASGEWTACFGLTEPEAGSDAGNIQTTAVLKGDQWVLNGTKIFITNADCSQLATVFALTDRAKRTRGGITAFLVETGTPGYTIGKSEKKMGLRGNHTCELIFDDCKIPKENVIGGDKMIGYGFRTAMQVLDKGRMTIAASGVGAAQRCLEIATEHAKTRVQFGAPLASLQAIQFMLAEMATQIYAGRQMLYHAAWLREKRGTAVVMEAAMVKLFCTEMANRVADMAVQIFGGMGYTKDCPAERFFRDLRLTRIYEGTSEIQKVVIARELLKD